MAVKDRVKQRSRHDNVVVNHRVECPCELADQPVDIVHAQASFVWTAVASSPSVDRDDEVVVARAFEPLPSTVPVRSQHFGGELIGSGRPYYANTQLYLDGRFASTSKAQELRTLVREGHLAHMSVVFMPLQHKNVDGRRHITSAELLAVDWAEIPSNRDARVLAVRQYGPKGPPPSVWKARIAALEAEIALMDLDLSGQALRRPRRLRRRTSISPSANGFSPTSGGGRPDAVVEPATRRKDPRPSQFPDSDPGNSTFASRAVARTGRAPTERRRLGIRVGADADTNIEIERRTN